MANPYTFGRNPEIPLTSNITCATCKNLTENGCKFRFCKYEEKSESGTGEEVE